MESGHPADLLAAFALDALTEPERERVAAHVTACAECRQVVQEFREVADLLPLAVDQEAMPPPGLRDRIIVAAQETSQARWSASQTNPPVTADDGAATSLGDDGAPRTRANSGRADRGRNWVTRFGGWLAAAALLIISLGLGLWNLALQQQLHAASPPAAISTQLAPAASVAGAVGSYVGTMGQPGVLTVEHLSPPPAGHVYEAWVIDASGPKAAGTFTTTPDGHGAVVLSLPAGPGDIVAITAEPAPGTTSPTGQVLLKGKA